MAGAFISVMILLGVTMLLFLSISKYGSIESNSTYSPGIKLLLKIS